VASAKIHVDVMKPEAGSVYYVRKAFVWVLVGLLVVTFVWVIPDLARRFRKRSGL
jgi:hypothetical protein